MLWLLRFTGKVDREITKDKKGEVVFYWIGWKRVGPKEYAPIKATWTDQEDPEVDSPLEGMLAAMMLRADRVQLFKEDKPAGKFRDWRGRVTLHWSEPPYPRHMTLDQATAIIERLQAVDYNPTSAEEELLNFIIRNRIAPKYPYITKSQAHFLKILASKALGEPQGSEALTVKEWRQLMRRLT